MERCGSPWRLYFSTGRLSDATSVGRGVVPRVGEEGGFPFVGLGRRFVQQRLHGGKQLLEVTQEEPLRNVGGGGVILLRNRRHAPSLVALRSGERKRNSVIFKLHYFESKVKIILLKNKKALSCEGKCDIFKCFV